MQPRHLLHSGKRCYQYSILSPRIIKQTVCICENRDADQLCCNCTSDRHLCYRIIDSTTPPLTKSEMTAQAGLCQTSSEPRLFVFPSKGWFNINRIYRVRSFTGMDINTGTDYRNGHYAVDLGVLNVFYLHKMYFWGHINSLYKKNSS